MVYKLPRLAFKLISIPNRNITDVQISYVTDIFYNGSTNDLTKEFFNKQQPNIIIKNLLESLVQNSLNLFHIEMINSKGGKKDVYHILDSNPREHKLEAFKLSLRIKIESQQGPKNPFP